MRPAFGVLPPFDDSGNADLSGLQDLGAVGAEPGSLPHNGCRIGAMAKRPDGSRLSATATLDCDFVGGARRVVTSGTKHKRSLDSHS
jgi:hypothetical protein